MTPTSGLRTRLRKLLDERIPTGGSAADTRFMDKDLDELLTDADTIYGAAAAGWTLKAGMYQAEMGELEQTTAGQETYRLTALKDRQAYALKMAETYAVMDGKAVATTAGSMILKLHKPRVL